ncbi:MAG: S8 family serine peptidase [Bacteroidia bacterium]
MKKTLTLCVSAILFCMSLQAQQKTNQYAAKGRFSLPANISSDEFMPQTLVLKVKPSYRSACTMNAFNNTAFNALMSLAGANQFQRVFPNTPAPTEEFNRNGQRMIDLSLTYSFKYSADIPLVKLINSFLALGLFEYVEPMPLPKVIKTTNDPYAVPGTQYNIFKINAAGSGVTGWDLSRGDSSVVIGITDTGTEPTHPDLRGNIKRNLADPIDGIDNDGDGYIDNYMGWDLGMNDNDPTWQGDAHGVHVSGICSAIDSNGIGVAGVGFLCKFLPVKIADATGALTMSYQGITYAADHGVKVINCSWGGSFGGSYGQSVIDYATINKDVLVVAACGNNNLDQDFFPSSFNGVLSVAATTSTDARAGFSNYNYNVGISAPGNGIYSTYSISGGSYTNLSGTSMASPCVAGVCAIVRSKYPSYNAYQTAARVKQTAFNNYGIGGNSAYAGKLGTGRVDMKAALSAPGAPWVIDTARRVTDNNDMNFNVGDTLRISATYLNTMSPTVHLKATLTSSSPYVQIQSGVVNLGVIGTMGTANNYPVPFRAKLIGSPALNQQVDFTITYTDTLYTASQSFSIFINEDYININVNDVATTITSKSLTGFNDNPNQTQGLGFQYKTYGNLMYEGGLMVGVSSTKVSNNVRGATTPSASFVDQQRVQQIVPAVVSNFDASGLYTDAAATSPLPIQVYQKDYAWTSAGNRKFVILQYFIKNTGTAALSNLYAGIFADYDITAATASQNKDAFDATNRMGYAWSTSPTPHGLYAGTKLLSHTGPVTHYAIDNITGGGGGMDISAGFSDANKYLALSTNRAAAGTGTPAGNDVCDVTSTGPFTIAAGDSIQVAFALIAGDSLPDLQTSAGNAQIIYDNLLTSVKDQPKPVASIISYPNPASGTSSVDLNLTEDMNAELSVYDLQGRKVITLHNGKLHAGEHHFVLNVANMASGVYAYRLQSDKGVWSERLIITH